MISKLHYWWQETRTSFWFVPAVIVLGAVGLAIGLIALEAGIGVHLDERWPLLFGAGAASSRGLLSAVASSMITVAGVVFSITIVALSLTSSQYTSRVLRNFMRDRMNQVVLGVFLGVFAYCLVVLRTIRSGDEGAFVPSLAVLGGLVLAFVGTAFLIYFIHYIAMSIQASSIVALAADETIAAVDQLFPKAVSDDADGDTDGDGGADADAAAVPREQIWSVVAARKTGYIVSVDGDSLRSLAQKHRRVVRMERGIGEFVVEGTPLASMAGGDGADDEEAAELNAVYVISRQRTVQQDVGFGIRQIVDIALKGLSPGINDTTTAEMCVDYLGAILARLAAREIAPPRRGNEEDSHVIAQGPCFESLLAEAFDQIRQNAEGNVSVLIRMLQSLEVVAVQTVKPGRRQSLRRQADLITAVAERSIPSAEDGAEIHAASVRLYRVLDGITSEPVR